MTVRMGAPSLIRAAALLALLGLGGCAESNPEAELAAFEASKPWLATMDAGDYERCWRDAAPLFRESESLESWLRKAKEYRDPLGSLKRRELNATTYLTNPWNAAPGEYTVVVYDSFWEAGTIYENVYMQRQADGAWRVAGYRVQQQ